MTWDMSCCAACCPSTFLSLHIWLGILPSYTRAPRSTSSPTSEPHGVIVAELSGYVTVEDSMINAKYPEDAEYSEFTEIGNTWDVASTSHIRSFSSGSRPTC